jgi:hypothetical protein
MARLLTIQKEDPIEYTHFDCWTGGCDADEDDPKMTNEEHCEDIIKHWETSLGLTLHPNVRYNNQGLNIYTTIGYEGVLDLVIMAILDSGKYDVYSSDTCIEIYPTIDDEEA